MFVYVVVMKEFQQLMILFNELAFFPDRLWEKNKLYIGGSMVNIQ